MVPATILNLIPTQEHYHWDYSPGGFSSPVSASILFQNKPVNYMNFGRNDLSDWVQNITKQIVDDIPESNVDNNHLLHSGNPAMVSHHNYVSTALSNNNVSPRKSAWNHQIEPNRNDIIQVNSDNLTQPNTTDVKSNQGLTLITLLMECAVAISVDNLGEAHRMLLELTQMASPYGPSCAERVVAYFAKAMASRVINSWIGICSPLVNYKSLHNSFHVFNNISPFIKFAHFTSNQAILEAVHRRERIHIVDLDIMQGLQWPALFHILANRIEGAPHVRMTGMGTSMELLLETGKQLSNFARRLGLSFEFHPIARKFGEMDASMVQVRSGETLAVHWSQHSLYDATGPDWKTLRQLEQLEPRILTMVEQDVSHGGSFLDRFVGSLHYYSTLFDSLGAHLDPDDSNRHHVEHCLLYREIHNILAIGGPARSGEDKFRHWKNELARHRFLQVPMSANTMAQAQLILNMFPPVHGYSLVQGDGTLRLGWKDTSLYTASAWTFSNVTREHSK